MDEIGQDPKLNARIPRGRWLDFAVAVALIAAAAIAVMTGRGGRPGARHPNYISRRAHTGLDQRDGGRAGHLGRHRIRPRQAPGRHSPCHRCYCR